MHNPGYYGNSTTTTTNMNAATTLAYRELLSFCRHSKPVAHQYSNQQQKCEERRSVNLIGRKWQFRRKTRPAKKLFALVRNEIVVNFRSVQVVQKLAPTQPIHAFIKRELCVCRTSTHTNSPPNIRKEWGFNFLSFEVEVNGANAGQRGK